MCACGSGKKAIVDTFNVSPETPIEELTLLYVDPSVTATRRSTSTVSGKRYYYGGNYKKILAFPEDVAFLTSLQIHGELIISETEI